MVSLFVSLMQAVFAKWTLSLPEIAVGQANIRGVTPNLFKIYISTTAKVSPSRSYIFGNWSL